MYTRRILSLKEAISKKQRKQGKRVRAPALFSTAAKKNVLGFSTIKPLIQAPGTAVSGFQLTRSAPKELFRRHVHGTILLFHASDRLICPPFPWFWSFRAANVYPWYVWSVYSRSCWQLGAVWSMQYRPCTKISQREEQDLNDLRRLRSFQCVQY